VRFSVNKAMSWQQGVFIDHFLCSSTPTRPPLSPLFAPPYLAESDFTLCGKQLFFPILPLFNSSFLPRQFYLAFKIKKAKETKEGGEKAQNEITFSSTKLLTTCLERVRAGTYRSSGKH
jgi:hypothetical protein